MASKVNVPLVVISIVRGMLTFCVAPPARVPVLSRTLLL